MTTIEFDKKVECNSEFVALRIIALNNEMNLGGIYVPSSYGSNDRLAFGVIENLGDFAKSEYGIDVGDYVLFDRLSTFCHTAPVCITRYNNIICKTNKDYTEFHPLNGMMFVEPDNTETVSNVGGIYVQNYAEKLNTGIIVDMNFTTSAKDKFKIGDRVLLVKGGDHLTLGKRNIHIFKEDMLVCSIKE